MARRFETMAPETTSDVTARTARTVARLKRILNVKLVLYFSELMRVELVQRRAWVSGGDRESVKGKKFKKD